MEKQTGMTFQLGSETFGNPYEDLSVQVALTELRDVSFAAKNDFACGHRFVVG